MTLNKYISVIKNQVNYTKKIDSMTFKFRTAPVIKSDTVLKLKRIGKTMDLLQAIKAERKNHVSKQVNLLTVK